VSYSAPDPLAGTEGPLHVEEKERKKRRKRKTERIARKEENSIK